MGNHEPASSLRISPPPAFIARNAKPRCRCGNDSFSVLPDRELYDYLCTGCASSVGQREVTAGDKLMARAAAPRRAAPRDRAPRSGAVRRHADRLHRHGRDRRADVAGLACVAATPSRGRGHATRQTGRSRSSESRRSPIKAELAESSVPVLQPRRIREQVAIDEIRALAPEVIVVMAYGQILPRSLLEIPRLACLNLHASLLPRHRGAAPIQAAIAAGDDETGITVIYMDEGLDTGDILLPVAPSDLA